jgi:hypothetical protein
MTAIRWSDNDRYFGPFTFARERRSGQFAIMLGSGDGDDYPGCRLRISVGKWTVIAALPPVLKPFRRWVDTSHYEWSKGSGGRQSIPSRRAKTRSKAWREPRVARCFPYRERAGR